MRDEPSPSIAPLADLRREEQKTCYAGPVSTQNGVSPRTVIRCMMRVSAG
jgi:hypothetical protein